MIDIVRAIQTKRERGIGNEVQVNSTVVSEARVSFKQDEVELLLKSPKENAEKHRNINFPSGVTDAFGTGRVYKFCFTLLEQSTDLSKEEIDSLLRDDARVGQSIKSDQLEILIKFDKDTISEIGR